MSFKIIIVFSLSIVFCTCFSSKNKADAILLNELLKNVVLTIVPFIDIPTQKGTIDFLNGNKKILISKIISYDYFSEKIHRDLKKYSDDYLIDNSINGRPDKILTINDFLKIENVKLQLIDIRKMNKRNLQEVLIEKEANAMIILTPFSFNKSRTKAIVYMTYYCGRLCGSVDRISFKKTAYEKWEITEYKTLEMP